MLLIAFFSPLHPRAIYLVPFSSRKRRITRNFRIGVVRTDRLSMDFYAFVKLAEEP